MMTTYRLSHSLPPSQRFVNLDAVLTNLSLAIKDNNVLTTHDTDTRLDGNVEVDIRLRSGLLLPQSHWLKYTPQQVLDLDRLLRR